MSQSGAFLGVSRSQPELDGGTISGATISGGTATELTSLGVASGGTAGFYGTTPITQRAGAAQATSLVGTASSADVTTAVKAALIEVMNTLAALGLWKGAA